MSQVPVLNYRPRPPRGRFHGALLRWSIAGVAVLSWLVAAVLLLNPVLEIAGWLGGGTLGTPFAPITTNDTDLAQHLYLPRALAYLALFLFMQWLFLMSRGTWRLSLAHDEPPSRASAIAAGFIGMLLSIGLLATLMEIPEWWIRLTTQGGLRTPQRFAVLWVVMGIVWAAWTAVFLVYFRSLNRYNALSRAIRWLVAGTILELVIAAPAHAWVYNTRGDECYCQRGTWTGVVFGCTAAVWFFGPGAFLLFMREKKRREELI